MSLGGKAWLHPFSRGEERKTDEKNITRRLNYSRLTAFDEDVFVKGTQDWMDLLCLLYAVQSRRCRRRRKGGGEKKRRGLRRGGAELRSWSGIQDPGPTGSPMASSSRERAQTRCCEEWEAEVRRGEAELEKMLARGGDGAHIFCLDMFLESTKRLLLSASNIITQWWVGWMATVGISAGVPVRQQRGSWGGGDGGGGGDATSKRS